MSRKRRDETDLMENERMSDEIYKLRRKVIDLIYHLNEFCDLPHITVRITKPHEKHLGVARPGKNIIWISREVIEYDEWDLKRTVYHEILHTVYNVPHIEKDPLMDPEQDINVKYEDVDRLFVKHAREHGADCKGDISSFKDGSGSHRVLPPPPHVVVKKMFDKFPPRFRDATKAPPRNI